MKTKSILFSLVASAALFPTLAIAEHWTEFRGAGQQGHAPADVEVPLRWSESQNIAWKTPIAGKAWSSPIVVGSRVFVTTAVEEDGLSLRVIAVDLESGKPIWDTEVRKKPDAGRMHKKNSHASPTPVFEDGKIYAHFGHHGTYCVDAKSGDIVWKQESIEYPPVHGTGGSPIVLGDKLIFSCDGAKDPIVVALDKSTGDIDWKTDRDVEVSRKFSFSTPLPIEVDGKTQVVVPGSGALISYDPENGNEIWRCLWGEGYSVVPRPVYSHGLVIGCSGFNTANMIAVDPTGTGDVTDSHKKWEISKRIPKESSPIVVGDLLFVNDDKGILSCVEVKTGEVKYEQRLDGQGGYSASPVYAGGHLFFHNGDGITTVVKPTDRFEKVAENSIGEYGLSSFGVAPDGFLIRTESNLIRVKK
ncbi:MAG: PQQ-binding-like beta-propeller repeat protein [Verrucomicrobiales bacterium]|nr:PQQ-binding-like beta-propeller repeat protein [Verrucomicrobiales bacterium]